MKLLLVVGFLCAVVISSVSAQVGRVKLSKSGPEVSSIVYGTLHLAEAKDASAALARIEKCLSVGITAFDLADVYAGGKALALFGAALSLNPNIRPNIQVIAKMDIGQGAYLDTSVEHIQATVNLYLKTLNTTYLDVVLFHWPDPLMDFDELAPLLSGLVSNGTVQHFGVSNFSPRQMELLSSKINTIPIVTNEIEISVLTPDAITNGWLDYLDTQQIAALAWGPIGGDPFGGYNRLFYSDAPKERQLRGALQTYADQMGTTIDVLALAWLLRMPRPVVPIIGTMQLERIANQSLAPTVAAKMSRQQWWQIAVSAGVPIFGPYSPLP